MPPSPLLQKGAIIGLDPFNPVASVIVFQYNPETLTRTVTAQSAGGEQRGDRGEALRLKGPPQEQIRLEVELDAADQLERGDSIAGSMGIFPALAALEMLLYPKSLRVIANEVLLNLGVIEVIPPEAPLTVFAWGLHRILPVRLTSLTITEEAFDLRLNPTRAKVSLDLRVLNYQDLGLPSPGGTLFMAHQIAKEVMATIGSVGAIERGFST
ncbi:MAG: hypothetical protein RMK84_16315 [Oscillochloridaceae bacterium]|nr:hypothetical protein [Chloroflexaceae bacterium]MDW8391691.1 hypothetical protein [Oscillochloridaceae bacterium]